MTNEDQTMLTTTDVAGRLGVSDDKVRRMCEEGVFDGEGTAPSAWRGGVGQHWRIPLSAVERFIDRTRTRILRRPVK